MKLSKRFPSAILASLFLIGSISTALAAVTPEGDVIPAFPLPLNWDYTIDGFIGYTTAGTLTVNGGDTLHSANSYLGWGNNATGIVNISGPGSIWTSTANVHVGRNGVGTLNITAGGTVSNGFSGVLGYYGGSSGTATVDGPGSSWANSSTLYIGRGGQGTLNVLNGGAVSSLDAYLGFNSGSYGTVTVDGAGSTWTNGNELFVGNNSRGNLSIANGGAVSSPYAYLGTKLGVSGTVSVDGTGSTFTSSSELYVGRSGNGVLSVANGATAISAYAYLGFYNGASGSVSVDGPGSTWTVNNDLNVGVSSAGTISITNSGAVSVSGTTRLSDTNGAIDFGAGGGTLTTRQLWTKSPFLTGTGTINARGLVSDFNLNFDGIGSCSTTFGTGGTLTVDLSAPTGNGDLCAGYAASSTLTVQNGAHIYSANGTLGYYSGASGTATVTGPGSTWTNSGDLYVGSAGTGTLNIANGGSVSDNHGFLGYSAGSAGTVTISDPGSSWLTASTLYVGGSGMGTVVQNGGLNSVAGSLFLAGASTGRGTYYLNGGTLSLNSLVKGSGTATFNFGGGTLQASGSMSCILPMTLTGTGGNANLDTNGYNVTLSGILSGSGGLNKRGPGTALLAGANTYTGPTTVQAGTLQLATVAQHVVFEHAGADIQGGKMVFNATGNPGLAETIRLALTTSYHNGYWDLGQFRSTTASPGLYTLGWSDGLPLEGATTDPTQITVMYTLVGDTDLDGSVGISDLNTVLSYYGQSKPWKYGDTDYDNTVGTSDLNAVLTNYGMALPGEVYVGGMNLDAGAIGALNAFGVNAVVPEPGTLVLLLVAAMALLIRAGRCRAFSR